MRSLTGSEFPSSELFARSENESTQTSIPGLRKQVQSDKVDFLDFTRMFEKGPFSSILWWLSAKCRVIAPSLISMSSTLCQEPPYKASKAIKWNINKTILKRYLSQCLVHIQFYKIFQESIAIWKMKLFMLSTT